MQPLWPVASPVVDPGQNGSNYAHDRPPRRVAPLQPYPERDATLGPWQQPDRRWVDREDCMVLDLLLFREPVPAVR